MKEINRSQDFGPTDLLLVAALGFVLLSGRFCHQEPISQKPHQIPIEEVKPEDTLPDEGTIYFYKTITDTQIAGKDMKMQ